MCVYLSCQSWRLDLRLALLPKKEAGFESLGLLTVAQTQLSCNCLTSPRQHNTSPLV